MRQESVDWAAYPFFEGVPHQELESLLRQGRLRQRAFSAGELLHQEDEPCLGMELILSGEVYVHSIALSGDYFTIGDFGPGQLLGGNLVFSRQPVYPMTLSGKAAGRVLFIGRKALFGLCSAYPDFLRGYLAHISDHAVHLGDRLRTQGRLRLRGRIARYLRREQQRQGGDSLRLPVSKTALAAMLGVRRSSLSRELGRMRDEGLIAFDNRSIRLLRLPEEEGP